MFINPYPSVSVCRRQRSEERERGEWALTSEGGTEGLSASGCHHEDTDTRKLRDFIVMVSNVAEALRLLK